MLEGLVNGCPPPPKGLPESKYLHRALEPSSPHVLRDFPFQIFCSLLFGCLKGLQTVRQPKPRFRQDLCIVIRQSGSGSELAKA